MSCFWAEHVFLSPHRLPCFCEDPPFFRCGKEFPLHCLHFSIIPGFAFHLWPRCHHSCGRWEHEKEQRSGPQSNGLAVSVVESYAPKESGLRLDCCQACSPCTEKSEPGGQPHPGVTLTAGRNTCTCLSSRLPQWAGHGTVLAKLSWSSGWGLCSWLRPVGAVASAHTGKGGSLCCLADLEAVPNSCPSVLPTEPRPKLSSSCQPREWHGALYPAALVLTALCSPSHLSVWLPTEMALGSQLLFAHRCSWVSAFYVSIIFQNRPRAGCWHQPTVALCTSSWPPLSFLIFIKWGTTSAIPTEGHERK